MRNLCETLPAALATILLAACRDTNSLAANPPLLSQMSSARVAASAGCTPVHPPPSAPGTQPAPPGLSAANGLKIQTIANVGGARELVSLPNGDLLVGTEGDTVQIVSGAQVARGTIAPTSFATIPDGPDAGVAFSQTQCKIFVSTQHGVYSIGYTNGQHLARGIAEIARVRTGGIPPGSDGDVHTTTSVAFSDRMRALFVGVGSSCNACVEIDPTRAVILEINSAGGAQTTRARRIRNAIALTIDPASGRLWAGGAGQDDLPVLHPYEFLDDVSIHAGVADYGWPDCEENHVAYTSGANCTNTVAPIVEFPAYATLIGAAFYPLRETGVHAFPATFEGGLFVTRHGSWHTPNGCNVPPEVDFVPMRGDRPAKPVDWTNPSIQWSPFLTGFQPGCSASTRIGRPTGIAVGTDGSLFVSDDQTGNIYRIRPETSGAELPVE